MLWRLEVKNEFGRTSRVEKVVCDLYALMHNRGAVPQRRKMFEYALLERVSYN